MAMGNRAVDNLSELLRRRHAARPGGVMSASAPPLAVQRAFVPEGATALELAGGASGAASLLVGLLTDVVRMRAPDAAGALGGAPIDRAGTPAAIGRSIQALGMWAQLVSIAELHDAMRARRVVELEHGEARLAGTFAHVFAAWRDAGVPASQVAELLATLRVTPTITAHPTEAKRVTVLEKHRTHLSRVRRARMPPHGRPPNAPAASTRCATRSTCSG